MAHYRFYLLSSTGMILNGLDAECDSDQAAIASAGHLAARHSGVEVWSGACKLAVFTAVQYRPDLGYIGLETNNQSAF